MKAELPPLFRPNLNVIQDSLQHHHEIFKTRNYPKRLMNYMNYSKNDYNIINLQNRTPIYSLYSTNVAQYSRETPNWNDSEYKQKKYIKANRYNSFIIRNIKKITRNNDKSSLNKSALHPSEIYTKKPDVTTYSVKSKAKTSLSNKSVRSFSYSDSKTDCKAKAIKHMSNKEKEVKRMQNLLKYINSLSTDTQTKIFNMLSHKIKPKPADKENKENKEEGITVIENNEGVHENENKEELQKKEENNKEQDNTAELAQTVNDCADSQLNNPENKEDIQNKLSELLKELIAEAKASS